MAKKNFKFFIFKKIGKWVNVGLTHLTHELNRID